MKHIKKLLLAIPITAVLFGGYYIFLSFDDDKTVNTEKNIEKVLSVTKQVDLEYAKINDQSLKLDLYIPQYTQANKLPVIVYIHGGGWIEGTKSNCPGQEFAQEGYVVACVDYRLATQAGTGCNPDNIFPAQIHDVKASVRWLRKESATYNLDVNKFAVMGASSGAHLAALLGVSAGDKYLAGNNNLDYKDNVQAVVDWYGPVDYRVEPPKIVFGDNPCTTNDKFLIDKYGGEETMYFYWTRAWGLFLGGGLQETKTIEVGKLATPLSYIDKQDPPFLIIHGLTDEMIPYAQSSLLANALRKEGVKVEYINPKLAGHGYLDANNNIDPDFFKPTVSFLKKYLK